MLVAKFKVHIGFVCVIFGSSRADNRRLIDRPCSKMPHQVPPEMFNEIIGHLWNDIPSLKACSLANQIMTIPSQK